ncbi:MAG: adenylate kinase [Anaerolineae bacterium]|nr:adenylate kinase [Anaerolineae bacterium]
MRRINVVGTSGSGKSSTAQRIAATLGYPHVEIDALFWQPDWEGRPDDEFFPMVTQAASGDRWVIDGNYSRVRPIVWARADTVVWLDYPLWVIMLQLLHRTITRSLTKQTLWSGNRESIAKAFFSRDSILLWALQTYRRRRQQYPLLFEDPQYSHIKFIRLPSRSARNSWLENLKDPIEV